MKRFVADCAQCSWESAVADTPEVAATEGVGHLQAHHSAVLAAGDVSFIRVWSFDQLRVIVGTAEVTFNAEPEKHPHPPPEEAERHRTAESKKPLEGRKGR